MDPLLMLLLLWSSGVQAAGEQNLADSLRLVGGASRCAGTLEMKKEDWRPVDDYSWTLQDAAVVCEHLDCGSAASVERTELSTSISVWRISLECVQSGFGLRECAESSGSISVLNITCSDFVRLVNGTSLCSGRLEVKSNQSNQYNQSWSSVCEADFDQRDAEVVCRELGCGPPSVLQGALYGEVEGPLWTREFQCGGDESGLLDCRSSGSVRSTCSPGRAVGLTCSDPLRLVGGASRCAGTLELKKEDWRPVHDYSWTLKDAAVVCEHLDCGSAASVELTELSTNISVWRISLECVQSGSGLRECAESSGSISVLNITCSDFVRLVNGTSLCSGRLEVKSNQSNQYNQSWSSVCEADFDQRDAEVVCRELNCGPPSVLQGALYGEVEAPLWTSEFQCGGDESGLLDCRSSGSVRNTCSPGRAVGLTCSEPLRFVGGASRCAGTLEVKLGDWRPVNDYSWTLKKAAVVCEHLDCGSAVSVERRELPSFRSTWWFNTDCVKSGYDVRECASSDKSYNVLNITCLDSVRLVNGTSLCSGRLEVKSNQSNQYNQSWSSVCEADFDQQDAEVVCRELGCGPPSVLQGALYGEVEAPLWTSEFQCGGDESGLLDCRSSGSVRSTCSPGRAVGLTCSDPLRFVRGASRCEGTLEVKLGDWRPVIGYGWTLKEAAVVCKHLDCGSAASVEQRDSYYISVWSISTDCVQSGADLRECASSDDTHTIVEITCSDFVRLVNGTSLCSGRLEVKSKQNNQYEQSWSSVCEVGFDQQDAEVVCRELGCGPPSVLQGALYGEVEGPLWTREFQCGGDESALLYCRSSGSVRNTCSPGRAVGLTCSAPLRLGGGASRCAGTLEVKHLRDWRPVSENGWSLKKAAVVCERLDCGSIFTIKTGPAIQYGSMYEIRSDCLHSGSDLRECATSTKAYRTLTITCSDSVRLVNGTSLCSGRLEVKSNQSNQYNQSWSSVCEADFDQQDAEVVCRELGCGPPSVLQGALYGEVEGPLWTREFQCGGDESALLYCRSSGSVRNTCSPGRAVGLTCSEPLRLVGGASRCEGTLEVKNEFWKLVDDYSWTLEEAAIVCEHLDCGSAVSVKRKKSSIKFVWWIRSHCVQSVSDLRECASSTFSDGTLNVTCSDLLVQPIISVSSMNGVSGSQQQGFQVSRGSNFTISCSIQPQYPGGFFQLSFTSNDTTNNYTQPAVNHSSHFLFTAAEPAHQRNYSCVYQVWVVGHEFSSESRLLSLTVSDPPDFKVLLIRNIFLPLSLLLVVVALCFYYQTTRGQKQNRKKTSGEVADDGGVYAAVKEGAQEVEMTL